MNLSVNFLRGQVGTGLACCGHLADSGCTGVAIPSASNMDSIASGGNRFRGRNFRFRLNFQVVSTGS